MEHEYHTLEGMFAPPPGRYGTQMAICGMTADTDILERAMATFTGQDRLARAAAGWARGVLMLDASSPLPAASAVPGLVSLAHDGVAAWKAGTSLLHAKVALMAFADAPFDTPTSFRLLVSTGNWTNASWGAQSLIDMYWCSEWRRDGTSLQCCADVQAAYDFLDRLMKGLYGNSLRAFGDVLSWWKGWHSLLNRAAATLPQPRFIHSLDVSLHDQIAPRFKTAKFHTVLAGSGFFEQARAESDATPAVLEAIVAMTPQAKERHLVFNTSQAGALAPWILSAMEGRARSQLGKRQRGQWRLHVPTDPLAKPRFPGRTQLHAKFVAGVARLGSDDNAVLGALYLGSGNLSRRGLMSHARLGENLKGEAGNIEAGIVTAERMEVPSLWRALARGKALMDEHIPLLSAGDGEPMHEPLVPPPALLARHEAANLIFVRSEGGGAFQFRLPGDFSWCDIADGQDRVAFESAPPPFVLVRRKPEDAETFEVPVATASGALCRQVPPQLAADDVLEGLLAFPQAPAYALDLVGDGAGGSTTPLHVARPARPSYPLRWLATVIEAIAESQSKLTPEQFPVWMSQVRTLLLEQVVPGDLEEVQALRLSLFPALLEEGFRPDWLSPAHVLYADYLELVAALQARWSSPRGGLNSVGAPFVSHHEIGA